jgi:hypothetical protein
MKDWTLIVVGDKKTPSLSYRDINCIYLSVEYQEEHYKELSDAIGWNSIMRRNLGFIHAYKLGADIVATVDDDNIPYSSWGKDIVVGEEVEVYDYISPTDVFDPMSVTNHNYLWHRGFPIQDVPYSREPLLLGKRIIKPLIQASLWDGDPDIDATCRYIYNPKGLKLLSPDYYTSENYSPFNSQNTFLARKVLPVYMVLPHVGRMDDIWGGYIAQYLLNTRPVFSNPTVFQDRNTQSIEKNFHNEILGYENTKNFISDIANFAFWLPEKTLDAFNLYREEYEKLDV